MKVIVKKDETQKKYSRLVYTKKIQAERLLKGISAQEMAKLMNIHPNTYYRIEYGIKCPTLVDINKVAEILGKPARYFFKIYDPNSEEEEIECTS